MVTIRCGYDETLNIATFVYVGYNYDYRKVD